MPAKKTASNKRKRAGASGKKAAPRKTAPGKKAASKAGVSKRRKLGTKKAVSKKTSAKKASKKKSVARKKAATGKKSAKSPARKTTKKTAKKAVSRTGKPASRKKVAAKPSAKKASTGKKKSAKRPAAKTASNKKAAARPAVKKAATKTPARPTPARTMNRLNGSAQRPTRQDLLSGPIHGIKPYETQRGEEYMSPEQLAHFEAILTSWKRELMNEVDRTVHHMQDEAANFPDPNDRATQESEFGLELRTRDRERKLLRKIDAALARIEDGTYGYCDETGEEIGLKRLEARPVATLCLEAQERREMAERQFRDRDDRYR
jgi:DnaK suppressor protein